MPASLRNVRPQEKNVVLETCCSSDQNAERFILEPTRSEATLDLLLYGAQNLVP